MNDLQIRAGNTALAASRAGDDPRAVFLHAGVADRRSWYDVMNLVGVPSIAYDRRGFGRTPAATERYVQVADLDAVVKVCVPESVTLVGNSQGGRIAIDYALAHPDRVERLVLIGSAISGAPDPDWVAALGRELYDAFEAAEDLDDLDAVNRLEALVWLDGPEGPEGRVQGGARELFLDMNGIALHAKPTHEATEPLPAWERLEELTMPITVIVGSRDLPHVYANAQDIVRHAPHADLHVLGGLAHLPQLEDPARVAALI